MWRASGFLAQCSRGSSQLCAQGRVPCSNRSSHSALVTMTCFFRGAAELRAGPSPEPQARPARAPRLDATTCASHATPHHGYDMSAQPRPALPLRSLCCDARGDCISAPLSASSPSNARTEAMCPASTSFEWNAPTEVTPACRRGRRREWTELAQVVRCRPPLARDEPAAPGRVPRAVPQHPLEPDHSHKSCVRGPV